MTAHNILRVSSRFIGATIQRFLTVFFFPGTFQMELEDSPTKEGEKSNWLTLLAKN